MYFLSKDFLPCATCDDHYNVHVSSIIKNNIALYFFSPNVYKNYKQCLEINAILHDMNVLHVYDMSMNEYW